MVGDKITKQYTNYYSPPPPEGEPQDSQIHYNRLVLTNKFKIHVKIDINVYTRTLHIYTVSIMIKYYSCSIHCLFLLLCYDLQGVETIILCIYTCNLTIVCLFINPRRACAARVTVVVLCVCLSVYDYSRTTGYEAAYERYQHLQCYKGTKNKLAILLKRLRSRDMA